MTKTRILYVTSEMDPYIELSKIAEVSRRLPPAMQEKGMEIRVLMPRYGLINERKHRLHEVVRLSGINVMVGDSDNPLIIKVASIPQAKMQVGVADVNCQQHGRSRQTYRGFRSGYRSPLRR